MIEENEAEKVNDCYVGLNAKGTIIAAMVIEPKYPERTAATIAGWIMEGLTIRLTSVEEVREKFNQGEQSERLAIRYHIQIIVAGKNDFEEVSEGDEDLIEEYRAYERYGEEPDWFQEEEGESDASNAVPDNQLPLF